MAEMVLSAGKKPKIQSFTSSGTFTVPANVFTVFLMGGGGGSGGNGGNTGAATGGGGGSAGQWCWMYPVAVTPGEAITVTRGAAGTGGTAGAPGNYGTAGGNTTFGSYLTLLGGTVNSSAPQHGNHGGGIPAAIFVGNQHTVGNTAAPAPGWGGYNAAASGRNGGNGIQAGGLCIGAGGGAAGNAANQPGGYGGMGGYTGGAGGAATASLSSGGGGGGGLFGVGAAGSNNSAAAGSNAAANTCAGGGGGAGTTTGGSAGGDGGTGRLDVLYFV